MSMERQEQGGEEMTQKNDDRASGYWEPQTTEHQHPQGMQSGDANHEPYGEILKVVLDR